MLPYSPSRIVALAHQRGSAAITYAGALRWLTTHPPLPTWGTYRGGGPVGDYVPAHYRIRRGVARLIRDYVPARYLRRLIDEGLLTRAETEAGERVFCERIADEVRDQWPLWVPSGSWAGGKVRVVVTRGTPACLAKTERVWSHNGKWSGNDLHVALTVSDRIHEGNVAEGGLVHLDRETVSPREERAIWIAQTAKGRAGLHGVEGWIVRGVHVAGGTLAEARVKAAKTRAKGVAQCSRVIAEAASQRETP